MNKSSIIIVYCSIGYRSEKVGEFLQSNGFQSVYNLFGGIFDWINKGFPVVDHQEQPINQVHGYSKEWGQWVNRAKVVY